MEIAGNNLFQGDEYALSVAVGVLAIFVTLGLFTLAASSLASVLTMILFVLVHNETLTVSAATSCLCIVLALVGAGAYSVDAQLFGQRRIVWPKS